MPCWTSSAAIARVNASTAPFDAEYTGPVDEADSGGDRSRH
jgi:hypothetical protein